MKLIAVIIDSSNLKLNIFQYNKFYRNTGRVISDCEILYENVLLKLA
jgi:hypothetical protein